MKLPRNISGDELARALAGLGYEVVRQSNSHLRLTTSRGGEHHITIPRHRSLKVGTVSGILRNVADHFDLTCDALPLTLIRLGGIHGTKPPCGKLRLAEPYQKTSTMGAAP